ncbi:MAG: DUF2235 domain-containing protein [Rhodoferax sp.]|nr:DUF2235 domain-containing protein [Rhodoferax sp.]
MTTDTQALQLVVCCDGTNNNLTGQHSDTNVVKLCELLAYAPDARRLMFYDPGVGNPADLPGASVADMLQRKMNRIAGLVFGRGVYENIADCYRFLMQHYPQQLADGEPAPEIFLLGFSRGAFTARAVAGLVNQFGLLQPHMDNMITTLVHGYFSQRKGGDAQLKAIAEQLRTLFGTKPRQVAVQFVGVWDTVAAVGMPPFTTSFTTEPRATGKVFVHVRHALALDEQRAHFQARTYLDANGPMPTQFGTMGSMQQRWFRGAHCDVGGGYGYKDAALSDQALAWLVSEGVCCGLRLSLHGQPLDTPERVGQALQQVLPATPRQPTHCVHSQTWISPWWALTGLAVRPTDGPAQEHPSVAQTPMTLQCDSVWGRKRPGRGVLAGAAVLLVLLYVGMGWLLSGHASEPAALLQAPLHFAQWQLTAPLHWGAVQSPGFNAAGWALLWDLPFILAYAYLLAWAGTSGFARMAGLRRAGHAAPRWLQLLGRALPLAVLADAAEDLLSAATLAMAAVDHPQWAWCLALAMALASLAKYAGLLGALLLALCALRPLR